MSEVEGQKGKSVLIVEKRANKKKNTSAAIAIATSSSSQPNANLNNKKKKTQKRKRLSEVSDAPIPKFQTQQGEQRPGNENPQAGGEPQNPHLPLPDNHLCEFVIDVLQSEDENDYFGQPVDPKEVEYYDVVIKEPIDFGTIRAKLQEGTYKNLNEFEYDVFLIPNNAMNFNAEHTIYFKKAETVNNLAKRVFDKLKTDPDGLKHEFSAERSETGREPRDEAGTSSTKRVPNHKRQVGGSNSQIGSGDPNIERRGTYIPSSGNDSIATMVYNGPKQLLPGNGGISYNQSLMRFAKVLGPTVHKIATQKLARCLTVQQPQMPTHSFIQQQPQMRTHSFMQQRSQVPTHSFMQQRPMVPIGAFMQQRPQVAIGSNMGQRPQTPTHSFMGLNPLMPTRPYNTGIVTCHQAPSVPCDPITTFCANERLGAQRVDKGKGILINDDIDISSGTLKSALAGYKNDVFGNAWDGNTVLGSDPTGRSAVTDDRVPTSGFFRRMLDLENDAVDDIDIYPRGGMSQNALPEERTRVSNRDAIGANAFSTPPSRGMIKVQPNEKDDKLVQVFKNQLSFSTPNAGFNQVFNLPAARPTYQVPAACPAFGPNSSLLDFMSRQTNRPKQLVHPSKVVIPSSLSRMNAPTNPGYQAIPGWNPPTPWGPQQNNEQNMLGLGAAPPEFCSPSPFGQDIMSKLQQPMPALLACETAPLRQTACMPMPARLASLSDLLGSPAHQEPQQGVANLVGCGAPQQQQQRGDAGLSGQLEANAPDPHVGRSEINPVGQGEWEVEEEELELELPADYPYDRNFPIMYYRRKRHGNREAQAQDGPGGLGEGAGNAYGGGAPQGGHQQLNYRQQYPELALKLGAKPPPSF